MISTEAGLAGTAARGHCRRARKAASPSNTAEPNPRTGGVCRAVVIFGPGARASCRRGYRGALYGRHYEQDRQVVVTAESRPRFVQGVMLGSWEYDGAGQGTLPGNDAS